MSMNAPVAHCHQCPRTEVVPLSAGHVNRIRGATWGRATTARCPKCGREYLIEVTMTPTHNPNATVGKPRKNQL